ncbi:MAG: ATP-binding cassette domain-containing protein [Methanoregula sp.]|jgi:ABC-2 type transport system ATP-binding protein|nr:ATP-binding cassette domain-containing protein [Methanoregula sp.]
MDLTLHNNGIDRSPEPAAQKDGRSSAGSSATAVYSTASGESIIQIEHLTKIFREQKRTVTAVNDVTFDVNRGEIFGLLGPNGAGKSTIIRILTTLLKPTSGTACVDTYNISSDPDKIREIIGVCPQNSTLDVELTAYDNLEFYGKLVNVDDDTLDARIWQLLKMADLADRAHMKVQTFSGGMRRKLEIVRAFIHHPLILFLDEPTIGLDPESRREVWQQIAKLNEEKTTIILTTHYMDEAEKLCNRIAFVDKGRLIALDVLENLKRLIPEGDLIEIGFDTFDTIDERVVIAIREKSLINSVEVKQQKLIISAKNGSKVLPEIVTIFENFSLPMTSISIHSPSLEDVFIYLTGRKLDDGNNETAQPLSGRRRGQ